MCIRDSSYTVNQTCTVLYTFTPSRPGQRLGAVSLTSPPGSILHPLTQYSLGTAFISGIGTGPLAAFPGSTTIGPVNSGYNAAADAAVDGNGDVFVGDYGGGNVTEIVAVNGVVTSSSTVKVVGSGFTNPEAVSYTHLDVYKRQVLVSHSRIGPGHRRGIHRLATVQTLQFLQRMRGSRSVAGTA